MRTAIVDRAIDGCALLEEVAGHRNGATVLFLGTVREVNDDARVSGLDYSAYSAMAERELAAIVGEAVERWNTPDVVVEHRIGTLELGEVSVAIAVAHPHRGEAYEASRYIIEELKKRLPIWKREHYVDGRSEWVESASGEHSPFPSPSPDVLSPSPDVLSPSPDVLSPSPDVLSSSPVILSEAKDLR